ncbi:MAG: cell wall-binding repeat-containing protein, partial [Nitriliruptorales bacterium]
MRSVAFPVIVSVVVALGSPPQRMAGAAEADVARVFGSGRVQTAVELSKATLPSAPAVVIVFGNAFPDAIAAAPLAAAAGGPILLNSRDDLHDDVRTEIERLGAGRAYVVGGEAVQGPAVVAALEAMGLEVTRVADETDT